MLTFNNSAVIKDQLVAQLKLHRAHDEIILGRYWEKGKGCAIGCVVKTDHKPHEKWEEMTGIPRILGKLQDGIFESLPNDVAKDFPVRFMESVPVGVDLSMVFYQFMHWLLVDKIDGVIHFSKNEKSKSVIKNIAALFYRKINAEEVSIKQWIDVHLDAASAHAHAASAHAHAASAHASAAHAYAYAYAAAAHAAYAVYAVYSAGDDADVYADDVAAYATAAYGANADAYPHSVHAVHARQQVRIKQADKLIELISLTIK